MGDRAASGRWTFFLSVLVILGCVFGIPSPAAAIFQGLHGVDKFACRGIAVLPGESRDEVAGKCGEPAWRQIVGERTTAGGSPSVTEEWVYDFGHSNLMEFLRFRDGRLVTIRSGNHGFGLSRNADCAYGATLSLGDTKLEVVTKCGDPTAGLDDGERVGESDEGECRRQSLLRVDEWIYDFGPDQLVHYLTFRHGRLMDIRAGGLGR